MDLIQPFHTCQDAVPNNDVFSVKLGELPTGVLPKAYLRHHEVRAPYNGFLTPDIKALSLNFEQAVQIMRQHLVHMELHHVPVRRVELRDLRV